MAMITLHQRWHEYHTHQCGTKYCCGQLHHKWVSSGVKTENKKEWNVRFRSDSYFSHSISGDWRIRLTENDEVQYSVSSRLRWHSHQPKWTRRRGIRPLVYHCTLINKTGVNDALYMIWCSGCRLALHFVLVCLLSSVFIYLFIYLTIF